MPGKHVRFAEENIFYSPPPMPSPSTTETSLSSLSSSSGPETPPQHNPAFLPFSPLPSKSHIKLHGPGVGRVDINPILQYSPYHRPPINYDLTLPLSTITTHHKELSSRTLSEPATTPALPSLTLICPYLPWMITVYAATHSGTRAQPNACSYVTVQDVLAALHSALQNQVSEIEYGALPSRDARRRVTEAYEARFGKMGWKGTKAYEEERRRGLKRIDFLMERKMFLGLSVSERAGDVWVLNVGS